ncbi:MAG TPA: cellulase family glycosylhydrolase, partial [Chitinophagaceae bacterium]|nr:cellulase family glycosylhydrolase [Chitinophagaceae bacterium]
NLFMIPSFRSFFRYALAAILSLLSLQLPAQQADTSHPYPAWWRGSFFGRPRFNPLSRTLPLIHVAGNRFVDSRGDTLLFRGVSIADPDKISHEGHWNKQLFEQVRQMGANLVRIPVHPIAWRQRTPEEYIPMLDSAAAWCTALGMYVDIDWHSIGNLEMELFQDPMYNTTLRETYEFWRSMARHFNGYNTVAFFELFNEPTSYRGQLGNVSWDAWKKINENMIGLIRSYDLQVIPLVAGFDWAYDLTPLREAPIQAENIGYVTHPYPNKRTQPWEPKWEEDFGFAAGTWPVIATEIGFGASQANPAGVDDYGNRITQYLESRHISWVAWVFDPEWGPPLLKSWNFDLTGAGEFFKSAMHRPVHQ